MAVQVSDFDRFSFTLFMALAVHAVVVLGITFTPELPRSSAQTMEITLSQFDDEQAPEKADFLAQTSQQGSGTEDEPREMTAPQPSEISQPEVAQVQPEPQAQTAPVRRQEQAVVQTQSQSPRQVQQPEQRTEPEDEPLPVKEKKSLMERSLEIASLEARFDAQQQAYARKPRVMRVTAASTLKSTNAWYVQNWVSKVTRVGNINYPTEARRAGVYGTLRMLVSMQKDGTIKEVAILQSSGSTLLDDAAIRIVRMAAPFAPFPDEMRKDVDELEIIRTWSFQQRGLTSG
ncbi:MAG: energy transducer TonB [Marinobacter sp.]|uniref:energy transducer TonB n=1 Tax=Marinobacter sp. TaxID=50741 RepID=UPI001B3FD431|nr:energy transducer TonB [Marinobacter sp.]MBQ0747593.1 energy transducer TonB [Marinobacter sp.]MBQ0814755.1 energy transducer TonB [Marinobacter sp.]|tara:strand:+ start:22965 stop:23831 length:867 start_codon:yes stop_codon:yes gene_type:complete